MFRKVLALLVAAVITSATVYAQYQEVPFKAGEPPPEARPGEAWCIYVYPAKYETYTEKVMVRDELIKMRPIPADYGQVTEEFTCVPAHQEAVVRPVQFAEETGEIVCVEAYTNYRIEPPVFKDEQVSVVVCPAYTEKRWVSPQFKSEVQTFEICPERKELRKVQCVDGTNIDCFTVVAAPAQRQSVEVKIKVADGQLETVQREAQTQLITVRKLVRDAQPVPVPVEAQKGQYRIRRALDQEVDYRNVPEQKGKVTRMTVTKEAAIMPEKVPAVYQEQQRTRLLEPEKPVWRKQLLNQMSQAPVQPPMAAVAAESIVEDYNSVPGAGAFHRNSRAQYK